MNQEPAWWNEAKRLRAAGHSLNNIGRLCGRDHTSVKNALDPEWRKRRCAANLARMLRRGFYSEPVKTEVRLYRRRILSAAREEAREAGRHIDEVLVAWGTLPRHHPDLKLQLSHA